MAVFFDSVFFSELKVLDSMHVGPFTIGSEGTEHAKAAEKFSCEPGSPDETSPGPGREQNSSAFSRTRFAIS